MNQHIPSLILTARRQKSWNQQELAEKIGVHRATIMKYEDAKTKTFKTDILEKLANALEKPLSYFLEESHESLSTSNIAEKQSTYQNPNISKVPIISWVHANQFQNIDDQFAVGTSDEYIISTATGKNLFALEVRSNCMEPEFIEKDVVIINPNIQAESSDYVIVKDTEANSATFKQLKRYGDKTILHPLNPKFEDIELDHDERYEIVGVVVEKIKKYR